MQDCAQFGTPLTRIVAPYGAPPKALAAGVACVTAPILAHPSRGSRPHREFHRRPQWHGLHASPLPSTALRGPIGNSTEGPSGSARMAPPRQFGTPVTRFVAKGPGGSARMAPPHPFRHTPQEGRCPIKSSTEGPCGRPRARLPRPFRRAPRAFRGPVGSSTEGPGGRHRMRLPRSPHASPPFIYTNFWAPPPHGSRPRRELHRRP